MRIRLYALAVLVTAQALAAAESATWEQLCSLLDVKRESKTFQQFSSECGLQAFGKRDGNYSGSDGIVVNCIGDEIVLVGVHVSESTMKLPFGLKNGDDLGSAARKLGISPTDAQKRKAEDFLELIVPKHRLVVSFIAGRLFKVGRRANQSPLPTPASVTPAAGAPVVPPPGAADR